jgi:hypothetical protein
MLYMYNRTSPSKTRNGSDKLLHQIRDSIVASIPACHAGDRGSIPRRGAHIFYANAPHQCTYLCSSSNSCKIEFISCHWLSVWCNICATSFLVQVVLVWDFGSSSLSSSVLYHCCCARPQYLLILPWKKWFQPIFCSDSMALRSKLCITLSGKSIW